MMGINEDNLTMFLYLSRHSRTRMFLEPIDFSRYLYNISFGKPWVGRTPTYTLTDTFIVLNL
jgi:hypothetical protein